MVKYLIASHGSFSEGTCSFLKIMAGAKSNVYTLSAFLDDRSIEDLVRNKLKEIGDFDQLLIFCDIHGGSVEQEIFRQTHDDSRNIQIIAGYNLPLIMELMTADCEVSEEQIRTAVKNSKDTIVYLNDIKPVTEDDNLF